MSELLTVKEVAELMRVSPMTVYRAVELGTLPHVRFGRTIRVDRETLDAFIQLPQTEILLTRKPAKTSNRAPVTRL